MMGGFKNKINNLDLKQNLFSLIISHISECCHNMRDDCLKTGKMEGDLVITSAHIKLMKA